MDDRQLRARAILKEQPWNPSRGWCCGAFIVFDEVCDGCTIPCEQRRQVVNILLGKQASEESGEQASE